MDEIAHEEIQKIFEISDMKTSNKELNENMSWMYTQAYKLGLEVNDQNQPLIDLRKCQGNNRNAYVIYFIYCFPGASSMTVASPMNHPPHSSSSFNWNKLKVLLNGDEYVAL